MTFERSGASGTIRLTLKTQSPLYRSPPTARPCHARLPHISTLGVLGNTTAEESQLRKRGAYKASPRDDPRSPPEGGES